MLILDMLNAYDEQEPHDEELLSLAERICDWLIGLDSYIESDILLLNKYQIIRRCRNFETYEIIDLAKLTDDTKEETIRCGAYLLLSDINSAQKCFENLPTAVKKEFLNYPICHFGELRIKGDRNESDEVPADEATTAR